MFCNTDVPVKFNTILKIKKGIAIYQELANTTERWEEKPLSKDLKGHTLDLSVLKSEFEPYFKTEMSKNELLFFAPISKNTMLVQDNYTLNWKITGENKMIAGYKCVKAITVFRDREWIAWFTPDIPLPFGPWKFHGLPGLILEVNDSTERYTYKLEKINGLKDDAVFKEDFAKLMNAKNDKPITYRQYLEDKDEASANILRSIDAKLNSKTTVKKVARFNSEEIKYEWEE